MESLWETVENKVRQLARELSQMPGHRERTPEENWFEAEQFLITNQEKGVSRLRAIRRTFVRIGSPCAADINANTPVPMDPEMFVNFAWILAGELGEPVVMVTTDQTAGELLKDLQSLPC